MKLVLQITLGVFLGTLASQFAFHGWRSYQEDKAQKIAEKKQAEIDRLQALEGARIRALLLQGLQSKSGDGIGTPRPGIVPDDAQAPK